MGSKSTKINDCKYRKRMSPVKSEVSPILNGILIYIKHRKVIFATVIERGKMYPDH
jgi:hypothetical protein